MSDKNGMGIFIIDDEEMVLKSLKNFLNLETDYHVKTFLSPQDALQNLQNSNVDMVISDYMMPDMDGLEFLSRVKEQSPDVIRILLTGYADKENAIRAINEVGLYQYIEKPWDNDDLLITIRNGLEKRILIKQLKEKIDELDGAISDLQGMKSKILQAFI